MNMTESMSEFCLFFFPVGSKSLPIISSWIDAECISFSAYLHVGKNTDLHNLPAFSLFLSVFSPSSGNPFCRSDSFIRSPKTLFYIISPNLLLSFYVSVFSIRL